MKQISVRGARTHNLKNINIDIPRDKLVVITGLSGSGKSSLAFDTLYAEGQRRYVESLSAYARQFLSMMEKPDVDHIEGLSPAISIEQKSTSHNPRSTVGTVTEIYDYMRLLFARTGQPRCPEHQLELKAQTVSQMVDQTLALPSHTKIMLVAPVVQNRKGEYLQLLKDLQAQGFIRARIDGEIYLLDDPPSLDLRKKHTIEVVIDRLVIKPDIQQRLADSFETALQLASGLSKILILSDKDANKINKEQLFSSRFSCHKCGYSLAELEPRLFSFNSPIGACESCDGLGSKSFMDLEKVVHDDTLSISQGAIRNWDQGNVYYYNLLACLAKHYNFDLDKPFKKLPKKIKEVILYGSDELISFTFPTALKYPKRTQTFEGVLPNMERRYYDTDSDYIREDLGKFLTLQICPECQGNRLNISAQNVYVNGHNLPSLTKLPIEEALQLFQSLKLAGWKGKVAEKILKEIRLRLEFLNNVGLNYLTLDRSAETLSGGEAQRIRLASQIGAGLVGVMYVLDEPTIGLHQRDNTRLIQTLTRLRDLGNTVIVVEHDKDMILEADYVIDIGLGAGVHGGKVIAEGTPAFIKKHKDSLTGHYLSNKKTIKPPKKLVQNDITRQIKLIHASGNNLQSVSVNFPIGLFTCVTGVSGSGKSTLINDTLYPAAAKQLNRAKYSTALPYEKIEGFEQLDKVIDIDQSPIGRTPRSNAATYTGLFTEIRDLFAKTQEARTRAYKPGRFSFNVKGGRCEACQGDGLIRVEMHFLADMYVTCDECKGKRYNRETLEIHYKGKNIAEVLHMTVEAALDFFKAIPSIHKKLATLDKVGLNYLELGQSATTLSGGEAQRIKLAKELSKRDTGQTLYILDEPTTGLHFHDVKHLLDIIFELRDKGNTIIMIEHNLDVIKCADWVIDLGPEGGSGGGQIVAEGTPQQVAKIKQSHTGRYLKGELK